MTDLRPPALDERGLPQALDDYVKSFAEREKIAASVHVALTKRSKASIETTIYRVVQGAMRNVAQHAHATRVDVAVAAHDHAVEMRVHDDGVGFDVGDVCGNGHPNHVGIDAMRHRVTMAGGEFRIESSKGNGSGTTVVAVFPDKE